MGVSFPGWKDYLVENNLFLSVSVPKEGKLGRITRWMEKRWGYDISYS